MKDFYDMLEINHDADKKDIRKAYREKAKRVHPDHGGDEEEFKVLALAKRVLMDDDERAFYDRTGHVKEGATINRKAEDNLIQLLSGLIGQIGDEIFWEDAVELVVKGCKKKRGEIDKSIRVHKKNKERLKKVLTRFKRKKKSSRPFLEEAFENMIDQEAEAISNAEKDKLVYDVMEKLITQYKFDVEDEGSQPLGTGSAKVHIPKGAFVYRTDDGSATT